jgi:hypothetical protein
VIEIRNETAKSAELYISGNIIDDDTGGVIEEWYENSAGYQWPDKIRQQLDGLRGKDLTIYINSDGGSVPAGVAMANMIARHEGHTTAIVDGWCCSIATQIFFAADVRRIPANAYLMLHKPAVWNTGGNANDLRRQADVLDTIQQGLEATYRRAAHEDVTDADIHAMVNEETWLTGEQAAAFFRVEVLEAVRMAACVGSVKFMKDVPADVRLAPHKEDAAKGQQDEENGCQKAAHVSKARAAIALAIAKGATI